LSFEDDGCEGLTDDDRESLRARSEQAIAELAQALIDSQTLHSALAAAFGAREKAMEAQHAAMGALNIPLAADVERLERRLRALSQRLEDAEEQIDGLGAEVAELRRALAKAEKGST
jgi:chromosome segregation ATPase